MTDLPAEPDVLDDPRFIYEYMYHGRASRRPWASLAWVGGFGLIMMATGVWIYRDLAAWEAEGGQRTMGTIESLLYDLGGKGLVGGLTLFFGGVAVVAAVFIFRRDRRIARGEAPDARSA